ncbi:MAG TPA: SMI1/KNR4 family protein [Blastocatellia bacterium]|nr:SMI1/KNR4 family protein [Blastocatellia bacterium]
MAPLPERLKAFWTSTGTCARPGVSIPEVEDFEARNGVCLPKDLRDYFLFVDGMDEDVDDELVYFVPLHEVKSVNDGLVNFRGIPDYGGIAEALPDAQRWFVFVNYMMGSHVYAIRLPANSSAPAPVVWICGSSWGAVADTFSDFGEKYLADRDNLLWGLR